MQQALAKQQLNKLDVESEKTTEPATAAAAHDTTLDDECQTSLECTSDTNKSHNDTDFENINNNSRISNLSCSRSDLSNTKDDEEATVADDLQIANDENNCEHKEVNLSKASHHSSKRLKVEKKGFKASKSHESESEDEEQQQQQLQETDEEPKRKQPKQSESNDEVSRPKLKACLVTNPQIVSVPLQTANKPVKRSLE